MKHYPADYAAPNVLSVAATSITTLAGNYWSMSNPEYLATWSDYGRCADACLWYSATIGPEVTSPPVLDVMHQAVEADRYCRRNG